MKQQNDNPFLSRVIHSLGYYKNKRVFAINREYWDKYMRDSVVSGATAYFRQPPAPLSRVALVATVIGVELGLADEDTMPLYIVREDSGDSPKIYNKDLYFVHLNPLVSTALPSALKSIVSNLPPESVEELMKYVLIDGPYNNFTDHHTTQVCGTLRIFDADTSGENHDSMDV